MSYNYSQNVLLSVSDEKLHELAHKYGYQQGAEHANIYQIADQFNTENQGNAIADVEYREDGTPFISITLTKRVSEHEGITGLKSLALQYKGLVDPTTLTLTDENNHNTTVVL